MKNNKVLATVQFIIIVLVVEGIGWLSGLLAGDIATKYNHLTQPVLSPPSYVFGIVWPLLYFMMATAFFIVLRQKNKRYQNRFIGLFVVQLAVNFIWSIIFFGGNAFWWGLLVIIVLDVLVMFTLKYAYQIQQHAGYLLVPYMLWLLFATYLTIGTAILN